MTIPYELERIIEESLEAVNNHPKHDLNLGYRYLVWTTFGPHKKIDTDLKLLGFIRRVNLAVLSTRHVMHIWESVWSEDKSPHTLLDKTQMVLSGSLLENDAWKIRNQYWDNYVEINIQEKEHQSTLCVGFSAVQALTAALQDEIFDPAHVDKQLTDTDIDADQMDSSFFSSVAYSGGAIWEPGSSTEKRKEFWNWWLREAVIAAWSSV